MPLSRGDRSVAEHSATLGSEQYDAPESPPALNRAIAARRRRAAQRWSLGILVPLGLLGLWQLASAVGLLDVRFIPPPSSVFVSMADNLLHGSLADELRTNGWASLQRLIPGFLLGITLGLIVGIAMGLFDSVRFGLSPVISSTFPIPKIAIFPLVIVIFGIGDLSKVIVVAIGVFYMVAINTVSGIVYSNPVYRDIAVAFRLPRRIEYFKIVVPAALPSIMAGVRLGFGSATIVLVAAEFVAAQDGIGFYVWNAWQVLNIDAMFGGLIVIGLFGVISNWLLIVLERKLIPWSRV